MGRPVDDSKMWDAFAEDSKSEQEAYEKSMLEAYKQGIVTKDQLIEEGLWDRMKARGAGAGGSIKSLGTRAKGLAQSATGKVAGALGAKSAAKELQAAGKASQQSASQRGMDARAMQLINSHVAKIERAIFDMQNDINKKGFLDLNKADPNIKAGIEAIQKATTTLKNALNPTYGAGTNAGAQMGQTAGYKGGSTFDPMKSGRMANPFKGKVGGHVQQRTSTTD